MLSLHGDEHGDGQQGAPVNLRARGSRAAASEWSSPVSRITKFKWARTRRVDGPAPRSLMRRPAANAASCARRPQSCSRRRCDLTIARRPVEKISIATQQENARGAPERQAKVAPARRPPAQGTRVGIVTGSIGDYIRRQREIATVSLRQLSERARISAAV